MVLMEVQFWHEELDTTLQGLIASEVFFFNVLVAIQPDCCRFFLCFTSTKCIKEHILFIVIEYCRLLPTLL